MTFNSPILLIIIVLSYLIFLIINENQNKVKGLVLCSFILYALWYLPYAILLFLIIWINYKISEQIDSSTVKGKYFFVFGVILNLFFLFLFKYIFFFSSLFNFAIQICGINFQIPTFKLIIPIGISYWTFVVLGYFIDIYNNKILNEKRFWDFTLLIVFFPKLLAGPIVKAKHFFLQINKKRHFSWNRFYNALMLISIGFFKKSVIADNIAPYVSRVFDNNIIISTIDAWTAVYAYSIQIYMDFSGYSDIAIGLALLFGYIIPQNFNSPYAATSFSDFWKRWHISLSNWIMEYLFLPVVYFILRRIKNEKLLGVRPEVWGYNIGVLFTMTLFGLWHGARINFVLWGLVHGFFLILDRMLKIKKIGKNKFSVRVIKNFLIFTLVSITWVIFRSSPAKILNIYSSMLGLNGDASVSLFSKDNVFLLLLISAVIFLINVWMNWDKKERGTLIIYYSRFGYIVSIILLLFFSVYFNGDGGVFIYLKF